MMRNLLLTMTDQENRPIPESYWVEPCRFLAGEYPGHFDGEGTRKRIDALIEAGFDMFVDLTRPEEIPPYTGTLFHEAKLYEVEITIHHFPIGDFGFSPPRQMKFILAKPVESLQAGDK